MIDKAPTLEVMRGWVAKHRQKQTPIQQFDISIDVNGQWFHEGSPIRREKMVALFASIMTRLDDGQFAQPHVERRAIADMARQSAKSARHAGAVDHRPGQRDGPI